MADILRIIFERGLEISRAPHALQYNRHVTQGAFDRLCEEVKKKYAARPVLVTEQYTNSRPIDYLLRCDDARMLEYGFSCVMNSALAGFQHGLFDKMQGVRYIVPAVAYHCKRLATLYSDACLAQAESVASISEKWPVSPEMGQMGNSNIYYEIDALITATRRAYDTLRYILWNRYGNPGSCPNNFIKTLNTCTRAPCDLKDRLDRSWREFGVKLTDYRDCIQHYVRLDHFDGQITMKRVDDEIWSATCLIPDNPDERSQNSFRFDRCLDALTYGWELTNELFDVAVALLKAVAAELGVTIEGGPTAMSVYPADWKPWFRIATAVGSCWNS